MVFHKNKGLDIFAVFFGFFNVIGKSYSESGNWDNIFGGVKQFIFSCLLMIVYALLFKVILLFIVEILRNRKELFRCEEKHSFLFPFLLITLMTLPYMIAFLPGTLHSDAYVQCSQYLGLNDLTGHHPVFVTMLMGKCLTIGREVFGSDNVGLFLYVGPQLLLQNLVFAYVLRFLSSIRTPVAIRVCALLFYGAFPLLPMWGCTFVKDTGYYVCMVLFITELAQIYMDSLHIP